MGPATAKGLVIETVAIPMDVLRREPGRGVQQEDDMIVEDSQG
jgi:hypothetical protein